VSAKDVLAGTVERSRIQGKLAIVGTSAVGLLDIKTVPTADVTEDQEKGPYFEVRVETEKTYLGAREGDLPITAGMQATVDIHTVTKTAIDFLIKPVLKMKAEAFHER
jgi:adhesin transport system membrane fusion protein